MNPGGEEGGKRLGEVDNIRNSNKAKRGGGWSKGWGEKKKKSFRRILEKNIRGVHFQPGSRVGRERVGEKESVS